VSSSEEYIIASRAPSSDRGRSLRVRIGEAFFRRWPVFVVPIVLLGALGALAAKNTQRKYISIGTVNVASSTYLSQQTSVNTPNFGYDTPAVKTARDIVQHLGSDSFATSVATNAGLTTAVKTGQLTLNDIRGDLVASATGDNLIEVVATTPDPNLSQRLAKSLMTSYTAYVLSVETAQYSTAVKYNQDSLATDTKAVDAANGALDEYLTKNPAPAVGTRPDVQTAQIQRLNDAVKTAQTKRDADQDKLDSAQLAIKQSESDIEQRLQVVDQPAFPNGPQSVKIKMALTLVIYLVLGLFITLAAVVVTALLDHSVRSVNDISAIPGLHVIGTIPVLRTRKGEPERRVVPELVVSMPA